MSISRNDAPLEFGAEEGETVLSVSASEILTDMDEELQIECVSAEEVILAKQPMASGVPDSEFTVYSPKRLSPAAPPFKPGISIKGVEPTTVAVNTFKRWQDSSAPRSCFPSSPSSGSQYYCSDTNVQISTSLGPDSSDKLHDSRPISWTFHRYAGFCPAPPVQAF